MKKILLINPGHYHDDEHEVYKKKTYRQVHRDAPPVSLLYIASYLDKHGFSVEIIDTHIEENYTALISQKIKSNDYVCVGMTVIIGKFLKNAREITELVRSINPDLPIIWGGIMASIEPEACLNEYKPDYIVRFEGEETFLELALALENQLSVENIKGISYIKQNKVVNNPPRIPKLILDDYPIPKWELFGKNFNKEQVPYYFLIMSSKGCPFNCKFCYKHSIDEYFRSTVPPWRFRTAPHVIAEIEYIHQKTGATVFTFGDDNFLVNKQRAIEIFDYFRKNNFYLEECIGHLNCLDDELIEAMAGIVQTFIFSVETASPRLQKYVDKRLDLASVPDKVQKLHNKGIVSNTSFIIGLPTETDEDLRDNIEMMFKIKQASPFARGDAYFFLPLPKTQLYDAVEDTYKVKLPKSISEWEEASTSIKRVDDPIGKKFRPWISNERFKFLVHYGIVFNEIFKTNNYKVDESLFQIISTSPGIKEMFRG
ncbi:MAG: radical SAM protein, partial [Candidatus Pacebacteria bacterium]|nr:radical SAM protein [Candidatus Paceibacterota bacterium]